jgi:hypothetical protein
MTRPARNPLDDVDRLLVDGNNLLHALRRGPGAAPPAALVGRIRAAIPPGVSIELVFDGAPEPGMRGARLASGVTVRHGGRWSADEVLLGLLNEARAGRTGSDEREAAASRILVITDDRDLRSALEARGARTARAAWLLARLDRQGQGLSAPTTGNRRPPPTESDGDDDASRPGWSPGRGATAKRGNPKRRPKSGGGA